MTRVPFLVLALALSACAKSQPPAAPSIEAQADRAAAPADDPAPAGTAPGASMPMPDMAPPDPETEATYGQIMDAAAAQGVASRPYGEIVQWVGEQLVGRPYVAGMLDAPAEETLLVDLTRFDCVLYIENVLAIARQIALGERGMAGYAAHVQDMRYRAGQRDGYCSRLHYFSDWIRDNEARGALRNVTAEIGGERLDKRLTFMSAHRSSYPRLAADDVYACIVGTERDLADVELVYLPKGRIAAAYDGMQPGDVVATTTSIGGLDVTHTGFVHRAGGRTGFMHASSASGQVKISPDLQTYIRGVASQTGVVIVRPVDPRRG